MLFGRCCYVSVYTGHWWSLRWKVLLYSEQCSASIATGNCVLWDGEGRKRFLSLHPSFKSQINILQYLSLWSLPNSMIWWLRSMTWIKMIMLITNMWRNRWVRSSENHCTGMHFHHVQMCASKASAGQSCVKVTGGLIVRPYADLHTSETSTHQDQVKVLIERTASSLDDTALKMLFVSVQKNNIELCIKYAINEYIMFSYCWEYLTWIFFSLTNGIGVFSTVCPCHCNPNDCVRLNLIQEDMAWCTMLWFGHSFVSECLIHWTGYSFFCEIVTSEYQNTICKFMSSLKIIIC